MLNPDHEARRLLARERHAGLQADWPAEPVERPSVLASRRRRLRLRLGWLRANLPTPRPAS